MGLIKSRLKSIIYFNSYKRRLRKPRAWYIESDEHDKFQHILEAVNYVRVAALPSVFFEFGCHSGRTFSAAILASQFLGMQLDTYAFDSFEGLPETKKEEDGIFRAGSFCTKLDQFRKIVKNRTKVDLPEKNIIKGFYEQSLTKMLGKALPRQVGFVHIDVDLYSSTVTVLEFIKDYLANGTVVLFDDWYAFPPGKEMGEKRALKEFMQKYPHFKFSEWKNYSGFGKSFFVGIQNES